MSCSVGKISRKVLAKCRKYQQDDTQVLAKRYTDVSKTSHKCWENVTQLLAKGYTNVTQTHRWEPKVRRREAPRTSFCQIVAV
jgi:predicted Ser/Thr protein kinase